MFTLLWKKLKNYQPRLYIVIIVLAVVFFTTMKVDALLLVNRVSGYIVLDVEKSGEAWYIFPGDNIRYYLGRPNDAYSVMRDLGIGITNDDLGKIPIGLMYSNGVDTDADGLSDNLEKAIGSDLNNIDTDGDGYNDKIEVEDGYNPLGPEALVYDENLINNVVGKILLQVEDNGEAWYVDPESKKRYYLARPDDAYFVMRSLSLGISSSDLSQINANVNLNTNINSNINENSVVSVPKNYSECANKQGENVIDSLSCWWLPKSRNAINKCKEVDNHWSGPEAECALIYYDKNFSYPKNIDQCLSTSGAGIWPSNHETICYVMIMVNSTYDKKAVEYLKDDCPGIVTDNQCLVMFKKHARPFTRLPKDFGDCQNLGGSVYPTGWYGDKASGYACDVLLTKADYPVLYQECVDDGGISSDKIVGTQGFGEGCMLSF